LDMAAQWRNQEDNTMGWFSRKPSQQRAAELLINLAGDLYERIVGPPDKVPFLKFGRSDSRYRCLMFCLSTVHAVCARKMGNCDAVLNEAFQSLFAYSLSEPGVFFGGPVDAQVAANNGGQYLQDYLHRWSCYIEIESGGNTIAALNIVMTMLRDIESAAPPSEEDAQRLRPVVFLLLREFGRIESGFR